VSDSRQLVFFSSDSSSYNSSWSTSGWSTSTPSETSVTSEFGQLRTDSSSDIVTSSLEIREASNPIEQQVRDALSDNQQAWMTADLFTFETKEFEFCSIATEAAVEAFAASPPGLVAVAVSEFGPEASIAVESAREFLSESEAARGVVKEIGQDICNRLASGFQHNFNRGGR
jgi:hypothetical protein